MPIHGDLLERPAYDILHSIQGGGIGEIKLVRHLLFDELCVQKTYDTLGKEDSVAFQEPRALRLIKHDHIVPVFDAQHDPDVAYAVTMVMPYYSGGSILDAMLADYRFSLQHAIELTIQILGALGHVHVDHNLLHRDIKPANVFLSADRNKAYLGDFGSAGKMDSSARAEAVETTPLYRAPETGPEKGFTSVPSDIYSTGMTLHEMLNGPFDYAALDPQIDRLYQRLDQGLRPLPDRYFTDFAPHVPPALRRIVRRATDKDPRARWVSAGAMERAIAGIRGRLVDWTHIEGSALDGRWEGRWPSFAPVHQQRRYEVLSQATRRGRTLTARQSLFGSKRWAQFGVPIVKGLGLADAAALHRFFETVDLAITSRSR